MRWRTAYLKVSLQNYKIDMKNREKITERLLLDQKNMYILSLFLGSLKASKIKGAIKALMSPTVSTTKYLQHINSQPFSE